jgi:ATP-dependent helicase HrpB
MEGAFELPALNHELKQFIARVNLVSRVLPELEFPPFTQEALRIRLGEAFSGLSLAKEAQAQPLNDTLKRHLAKEQVTWLDELAPTSMTLGDGRKVKLLYVENDLPEVNVKLHECFGLSEHPCVCEGKAPVRLWLCSPDGKRIEPTTNWPKFRQENYPKIKSTLTKKFPGFTWL